MSFSVVVSKFGGTSMGDLLGDKLKAALAGGKEKAEKEEE